MKDKTRRSRRIKREHKLLFPASHSFQEEIYSSKEGAVHDDDCDIKIKINSIPSQKRKHSHSARHIAETLNARSRFFKFTPCKDKNL